MGNNQTIALLLEDEPLISMDVEQILESAGFGVSKVMSCDEADAWLDQRTPNVVIVDIVLKDGPSNRIAQRLVNGNIPFIVHSGDVPSMHQGTPFAAGGWVSKPSSPGELVETIRTMLAAA